MEDCVPQKMAFLFLAMMKKIKMYLLYNSNNIFTNKLQGCYKNDFILNLDHEYMPKLLNSHIFVIYYRRDLQNFYLDNFDENKEKYFIFVRLDKPHPVFEGEDVLISVLDYNFKLKVDPTYDLLKLNLKERKIY